MKCKGEFMKGKIPWNKGISPSVITRKHMSEAQLKRNHRAEKCYQWKGGSWVWWQAEIKKRDHFTCVNCGLYEPDIVEVAHRKPIKGLKNRNISGHPLNSYENLTTLCPNCHAKFDKGLIKI
jgi:5-methylcytosine-specific restriction endonuclease McrA